VLVAAPCFLKASDKQARETQSYPQQGIRSCNAIVETNGVKYVTDYSIILNDKGFFVQVENAAPCFLKASDNTAKTFESLHLGTTTDFVTILAVFCATVSTFFSVTFSTALGSAFFTSVLTAGVFLAITFSGLADSLTTLCLLFATKKKK